MSRGLSEPGAVFKTKLTAEIAESSCGFSPSPLSTLELFTNPLGRGLFK